MGVSTDVIEDTINENNVQCSVGTKEEEECDGEGGSFDVQATLQEVKRAVCLHVRSTGMGCYTDIGCVGALCIIYMYMYMYIPCIHVFYTHVHVSTCICV